MRHYSKIHGKHCHLRSFKTTCRKCGADVLYWECTHGCKVFFDYPPYGKLIRHHCMPTTNFSRKNKYKVIVKPPQKLFESHIINCPICGKSFTTKSSLEMHVQQLQHQDIWHKAFIENKMSIQQEEEESENELFVKPKFGRINIRKKK